MASSSIVDQANEDQAHPSMMAWRVHEFGPPNFMRFEQVPRPDPGPGEVLVKVEAAGVGPWDGWIRAGKSALPPPASGCSYQKPELTPGLASLPERV
jgi:NADPH:quinone reductase-like Zn-dependent oxidoreductase